MDVDEVNEEVTEKIEDFLRHEGILADGETLEHVGVKGMKWGHTKAGAAGGDKNSFFNKPGAAKAIILGSYGKKSAYTNSAALAKRKTAGKLRIAAVIGTAGAVAVSAAGRNSAGAQLLAGVLSTAASGVMIGSLVTGASGASIERQSRIDNNT